jgi:hypothetical protein
MGQADSLAERARREEAWRKLIERLKSLKPIDIGPWTRDELYQRSEPDRPRKHCPTERKGTAAQ